MMAKKVGKMANFVLTAVFLGGFVSLIQMQTVLPREEVQSAIFLAQAGDVYVAFGDSITRGVMGGTNYPDKLEDKFQAYYGEGTLIKEGIGGEEASDGKNRIGSVISDHAPDYILILEGTNDIQAGADMDDLADDLFDMCDEARARGVIPVLGMLSPRQDVFERPMRWVNDYYLKPEARDRGILIADHYGAFMQHENWKDLLAGRTHPNDAGYEVMAQCWFDALLVNRPPEEVVTEAGDMTVHLEWEANTDVDMVGYNIYRRQEQEEETEQEQEEETEQEQLNSEVLTENSYQDEELENGVTYYYAITVVDRSTHESAKSQEVSVVPDKDKSDKCFVATAAWGTPMSGEVVALRHFRDRFLLTNSAGRFVVAVYEKLSPPLAEKIRRHPGAGRMVRMGLRPLVFVSGVALRFPSRERFCCNELMATALLLVLLGGCFWRRHRRNRPGISA